MADKKYNLRSNPRPSIKVRESLSADDEHQTLDEIETHEISDQSGLGSQENFVTTVPEQSTSSTDTAEFENLVTDIENNDKTPRVVDEQCSSGTADDEDDDAILTSNGQDDHRAPISAQASVITTAAEHVTDRNTNRLTQDTVPTAVTMPHSLEYRPTESLRDDMLTQLFSLVQDIKYQNETLKSDIKAEIKSEINEIKSEIKSQNDVLKSEIKSDIKAEIKSELRAHNETIKSEILNCRIHLENQITEIKSSQERFCTEIEEINEIQQKQSQDISKLRNDLESGLDTRETEIREHLIQDLENQTATLKTIINDTNTQTFNTLNNKIEDQGLNLTTQIKNLKTEQNSQINILFQQKANQLENTLAPLIESNRQRIEDQNTKIEKLQTSQNAISTLSTNPIQVICTGNSSTTHEQTLPKFTGRGHNPKEFIEKLYKYYKRTKIHTKLPIDEKEHLIEVIEMSLEHHASRWFNLIKNDIHTWNDFETAFLNKYWSRDVQRGIRQRLETEKYRPNGSLSRAEYFVERVLMLQSLTPPLGDEEVIACLCEHFDELIQDAYRVQNINTIQDFEALLQREDIKDLHKRSKPKHINSPQLQNPSSPNRNQRDRRGYDNERQRDQDFRAYQPPYRPNNRNNNYRGEQRYNPDNQRNYGQHRDQNPYIRPQSPRRDQHRYPPLNTRDTDRRYPTNEQGKICATMSAENTTNPRPPPNQKHLNN